MIAATAATTKHKLAGIEPVAPDTMRSSSGIIIVNMGPSGAGKTTLLETLLPKYAPVAVLDHDGKGHVLRNNPSMDIYPSHTWKQTDLFVQDLERQSRTPYYKTVVFDGTTALQLSTWDLLGIKDIDNPQLRQSAYGKANSLMIDLAQRVRLLAERGTNIIFNVWAVKEKAEMGPNSEVVSVTPDVTPTLLNRMLGMFDFVVYTEPAPPPKPYPPIIRTGGSPSYATRSATSPESQLRDLPPLIYNPSYTSIIDSFHGEKWPTDKHKK